MTATPGQPVALYARWYRVDEANATDADVARGWQITFRADREFWTDLDTAAAELGRLRKGIADLAATLTASAAVTRPSRKSEVEDETAIALRKLLEA